MPVAVFLVAVVLRLAFGLGYWNDKPLTRDEQEYLALAASLAGGHGFTYDRADQFPGGDRFSRAPGYPAFIAAVMWPDDDFRVGRAPTSVPIALEVVQAAMGAVGVLLIGVLTRRAAGPRAGVVAAWLAAFHPALVWISAYALSEALFSTVAARDWSSRPGFGSCRHLEQVMDALHLLPNSQPAHPPRLPLPDHVHRLVALDRAPPEHHETPAWRSRVV